ncbi:MAG: fibronectin type III domain-containing protein, partial [Synergistaceae bacterium]|nr:fibronectin type III domain-containing protein [Synergistaceae bacterium]
GGHNSSGGKITITGGAVTALPGKYTRSNSPESSRIGVGIGGGRSGSAGEITITGGSVVAVGGKYEDRNGVGAVTGSGEFPGIGGGASGGTLTIGGNDGASFVYANSTKSLTTTNHISGIFISGTSAEFKGNSVILTTDATVPEQAYLAVANGQTLTVSEGVTLTISKNAVLNNIGTVTNNGRILNLGTITNSNNIQGSGELRNITLPGAPTINNESITTGDDWVSVAFTLSDDNKGNGENISYTVRCYDVEQKLIDSAMTTGSESPIKVEKGLAQGTTYYFTVSASNEAGEGNESAPSGLFVPGVGDTTYAVELAPEYLTFREPVGYEEIEALDLAVKNVGTGVLSGIIATLEKDTDSPFEITVSPGSAIPPMTPGSANNVTVLKVRPKTGLAVGTYSDVLTVSATWADPVTAELAFTVAAAGDVELVPDNYMMVVWTNTDYKRLEVGSEDKLWARAATNGKELYGYKVNFEKVSGDSISVDLSQNSGKEAVITAVSPGTSVVKVTYSGAPDINSTYVVYDVENAGSEADVEISTSLEKIVTIDDPYQDQTSGQINGNKADISTYDTIYFTNGDTTPFIFEIKTDKNAAVTVSVNGSTGETKPLTAAVSGDFTVTLANRSNIIEVKAVIDGKSKSFYKVVDARKIEINVENITRPGANYIVKGDTAKISFKGIELPLFKIDGIYNPSAPMGSGAYEGKYSCVSYSNERLGTVEGYGGQYNLATNNAITLTLEDAGEFAFTDGKITEHWWGRVIGFDKFLRDAGGQMAGGSGNATLHTQDFSSLPDFTLTVLEEKPVEPEEPGEPEEPENPGEPESGKPEEPGEPEEPEKPEEPQQPGDNGGGDPVTANKPEIVEIPLTVIKEAMPEDIKVSKNTEGVTAKKITELTTLSGENNPLAQLNPDTDKENSTPLTTKSSDSDVLMANPNAIIEAIDAGRVETPIDVEPEMIPLPVVYAEADEGADAAALTFSLRLDQFARDYVTGDITLLKIKNDGSIAAVSRVAAASELGHARYLLTDDAGVPVPTGEVIKEGVKYLVTVGIKDNSDYDWDNRKGTIVDPMAVAAAKDDDSSGGCSTGSFGAAALIALGIAVLRRRGAHRDA